VIAITTFNDAQFFDDFGDALLGNSQSNNDVMISSCSLICPKLARLKPLMKPGWKGIDVKETGP
jgi:hypothetical protein